MDATIVMATFHSLNLGAEATWTGTEYVGVPTGVHVAIPVAVDPFAGNTPTACKWELAGATTWELTNARGIVNVTTDWPLTAHPLQLWVTVDWGTEGSEGSVGQYVTVVVTGTRYAGLVLHIVVYITSEVRVISLMPLVIGAVAVAALLETAICDAPPCEPSP